ncbi:FKBP-type peptidyl-prolyl cis-trans isomerase [Streptomyces albipurpureus]|uniref:Peptidyl-prolyl cis-trans isomerase n=1 Tax=Streptomyces albipurpureus TaxID=2897419 RepID=A0ABT0UPU2_9ACTN|nr:FKBP-type peptidyl-prolyl cis-trans isomerase [Streptomyces sp. CWNU-1]MCM2390377.1 FKBP-type peptidyl-prolyl cis-trans isomerase [Streptomyces sp. CWNU-1]
MRRLAGLLVAPLLLLSTVACGSEDKGSDSVSSKGGLPAITAGEKFGQKPTLAKGEGDPPKQLKVEVISAGKGATLKKGDLAQVNYLGQEWDEDKPFDNSFDRGQPFDVSIGGGGVIEGWQKALDGQKVGSRLEASIPADLGYGAQGQGDIKPNATLVFVMDVVSAKSVPVSAKGTEVAQDNKDLPKVGTNTDGKAPKLTIPTSAPPKELVASYILEGTGPALTAKDGVVVKYEAALWKDSKPLGGTYQSDATITWKLDQIPVKGIKDGVIGKKLGSRVMLVIPPGQGFPDAEQQGIPKDATLVFSVDLLTKP